MDGGDDLALDGRVAADLPTIKLRPSLSGPFHDTWRARERKNGSGHGKGRIAGTLWQDIGSGTWGIGWRPVGFGRRKQVRVLGRLGPDTGTAARRDLKLRRLHSRTHRRLGAVPASDNQ